MITWSSRSISVRCWPGSGPCSAGRRSASRPGWCSARSSSTRPCVRCGGGARGPPLPRPACLGQRGRRLRLEYDRRPPGPAALQARRGRGPDRDGARHRVPDHPGMRVSPAARVAAMATAVIAVVYIICVTVLNTVVSGHLTDQNDERLAARLAIARHDPDALGAPVARVGLSPASEDDDIDGDSAPVFLWSVNASGAITAHSPNAPALPATLLAGDTLREGFAKAVALGSAGAFRLKMTRAGNGWLMAGQSLVGEAH